MFGGLEGFEGRGLVVVYRASDDEVLLIISACATSRVSKYLEKSRAESEHNVKQVTSSMLGTPSALIWVGGY